MPYGRYLTQLPNCWTVVDRCAGLAQGVLILMSGVPELWAATEKHLKRLRCVSIRSALHHCLEYRRPAFRSKHSEDLDFGEMEVIRDR
jgi:hypothetical protein